MGYLSTSDDQASLSVGAHVLKPRNRVVWVKWKVRFAKAWKAPRTQAVNELQAASLAAEYAARKAAYHGQQQLVLLVQHENGGGAEVDGVAGEVDLGERWIVTKLS